MMITLGLGLVSTSSKVESGAAPTTTLTVADFSRDKTLFDSGAAFGRNSADVSLSGSGTPTEVVEVRLLPSGGAPTFWSDLTTITTDGTWQASISLPRSADWMRAEVRIKSEPVVRAATANRFGVGHVIAFWGQSEVVRIRSTVHNSVTPEPLIDEDAFQVMWYDNGAVIKHLTNSDPHSAPLAAMANVFVAERPGEKFAVVLQAVSGTGFRALADDTNVERAWVNDAALHAFATADGQHVGLPAVSWFASPGALSAHYEDALFPLFTGKNPDGSAVSFPATISYGNSESFRADHWFGELYDPSHTKWVPYGPHRFDIYADMQNATTLATGDPQVNLANKESARLSWRSMVENHNADGWFLPLGLEPLTYSNGVSDGAGGWTDQSHPSGDTDDGTSMFARLSAYAVLQAADLVTWDVPEFDQVVWEPSGAYVEVWSSAGPVTTLRSTRVEAPLADTHPHWTDVLGWQINGQPAQRAEIVSGRVRLYPNSGSFTASDVIRFGEGGATGMVKYPDDFDAGVYKDLPIVDTGALQLEGIPVRTLPSSAVLANTLIDTTPSFTTSATGPHFADTQQLGAGVGQLQARLVLAPSLPASGTHLLMATTGNYVKLEILSDGALRLRLRDAAGIVHVDNVETAAGVVFEGVEADIVLSIDMVAGFMRLWVNGNQVFDQSFVSVSAVLPSNRTIVFLAALNGATQVVGTVNRLAVWKTASVDGSNPATLPYKEINDAAGVVNLDPWKLGADAT